MMAILLKNGADPDRHGLCTDIKNLGYKGITALHLAVAENNFEAVKLLVEYGADINACNDKGQTPLHAALNNEIADYLIRSGANVNLEDKKGNSPLHAAAKYNKLPVLESLLAAPGIIVDSQNHQQNTPLSMAAHYGVSATDRSYNFFASERRNTSDQLKHDNLECVAQLIKAGAHVNHQNLQGNSPLLLTLLMSEDCMDDRSETRDPDYDFMSQKVKFLCKNGADTNLRSSAHDFEPAITPLQALYRHDIFDNAKPGLKKSIAETLVTFNADPKVTSTKSETLLHQCARNGDAQDLAYLIEKCQLDPNATDTDGVSPLETLYHWGMSSDRYKLSGEACLQVLIDHGADPTIKRLHTFNVNSETLNPNSRGIYLHDHAIEMILSDENNVFGQKAARPLPTDATQVRLLFTQLYQELAQESVDVTVALYPEQCSFFSGKYNNQLQPSREAVEHIQVWRQEYIAQQNNTLAL